jgi:O-acetylhomoserine/O-acetylserine sulfhydrylase-like pyridoxal-dependent enzyme
MVDNTVASPYLLNIAHGQILLFILDKIHLQAMAPLWEVIIDSGTFDWVVVVFLNSQRLMQDITV